MRLHNFLLRADISKYCQNLQIVKTILENSFTRGITKNDTGFKVFRLGRETVLKFELEGTTARKESKYGVISCPYFSAFGLNTERYEVFSPNAGKYGPEITPYLVTFHAVHVTVSCKKFEGYFFFTVKAFKISQM